MRLVVGLFALLLSGSVFAAGDAGCGLGNLVMSKNTKVSQTFAVTTNGTFLSQLFGITSGTSGCSASGFVYNEKEATVYAEANMPSLKIEMARGQGENLNAFAQVLGCKQVDTFATMTKAKYSEIFTNDEVDAHQMLKNVQTEIQSNPELRQGCGISG